ncbi:hypothetical protein CDO52_05850 [Nocardiopsis gilva YIM 90087]|uniref:Uncharacterized protein n=1 Tax=Nocardiopsis gilva YIM 90087 TaxID=1235441 RepID=A0A223S2M4_9ACTN|nr:hypothetical protein [Nocardiopsis gilva]ASU82374.1 hypothetical protein CDO52_05850 [Nocardiopsis gilva YIM 90087]
MDPAEWMRRAVQREVARAIVTRERAVVEDAEPLGYLIAADSPERMREQAARFLAELDQAGGPITA